LGTSHTITMNDRQWKKYDQCQISVKHGRSKNWGLYQRGKVTLYVKNITPSILYEVLTHEMIHYCIEKFEEKMPLIQEERIIYFMSCAENDWI